MKGTDEGECCRREREREREREGGRRTHTHTHAHTHTLLSVDLWHTFGLLHVSFGNTAPPRLLMAALIFSISTGKCGSLLCKREREREVNTGLAALILSAFSLWARNAGVPSIKQCKKCEAYLLLGLLAAAAAAAAAFCFLLSLAILLALTGGVGSDTESARTQGMRPTYQSSLESQTQRWGTADTDTHTDTHTHTHTQQKKCSIHYLEVAGRKSGPSSSKYSMKSLSRGMTRLRPRRWREGKRKKEKEERKNALVSSAS